MDGRGYYYNNTYDSLSFDTLEEVRVSMNFLREIIGQVYNAIGEISNQDENKLDIINKFYERTFKLISDYEKNVYNTIIYDLAGFETNERALKILANEFALEAYDEYLEKYVQISLDIANEQLSNLCNEAKLHLDNILGTIDEFIDNGRQCIDFFKEFELRRVNDLVYNTQL